MAKIILAMRSIETERRSNATIKLINQHINNIHSLLTNYYDNNINKIKININNNKYETILFFLKFIFWHIMYNLFIYQSVLSA